MLVPILCCDRQRDGTSAGEVNAAGVQLLRVVEFRNSLEHPYVEYRPRLSLVLKLTRPELADATHVGQVVLSKSADDKGRPLALAEPEWADKFLFLDRDKMKDGYAELPSDSILVELPFRLPERDASTLDVAGTFQVRLASRAPVTLRAEEIRSRSFDIPVLTDSGLSCKIVVDDRYQVPILEFHGELNQVRDVQVFDGQSVFDHPNDGWAGSFGVVLPRPIPDGFRITINLSVDERLIEIPFSFTDLALP